MAKKAKGKLKVQTESALRKKYADSGRATDIVVSADVQKGTKEEVEGYGIVTFINKPLTPDKLQQLINLIRGE